jgi:hypothetical protein
MSTYNKSGRANNHNPNFHFCDLCNEKLFEEERHKCANSVAKKSPSIQETPPESKPTAIITATETLERIRDGIA